MGAVTADNVFYSTPGTVPSSAVPVPACNDNTVRIAGDPGVNSRKGIVVWLHPSMNSDYPGLPRVPDMAHDAMAVQDFVSTAGTGGTGATGIGWVTVVPKQPVDNSNATIGYPQSMANFVNADPNNGTLLVNVYRAWFRKLCLYLKRKFKVANPPIILLGYSLGAWVSAYLAATESSRIVGYGCHCLPTLWSGSTPLFPAFTGANTAGIDLGTTFLQSMSIPGIIGHSESPPGTPTDQVVGWTLSTTPKSNGSAILASAANMTGYTSSQAAPDHIFNTTDASEYVNWISSTFPLSASF